MTRLKYSTQLKNAAVNDFNMGMSVEETCRKHGVKHVNSLYNWIRIKKHKEEKEKANILMIQADHHLKPKNMNYHSKWDIEVIKAALDDIH